MKLTLFYVSYAFLVATFVFHILGVSTNSWWKSASRRSGTEVVFSAGLWKVCLQGVAEESCVDYMNVFDVHVGGVNVHTVIGEWMNKAFRGITCIILYQLVLFHKVPFCR